MSCTGRPTDGGEHSSFSSGGNLLYISVHAHTHSSRSETKPAKKLSGKVVRSLVSTVLAERRGGVAYEDITIMTIT